MKFKIFSGKENKEFVTLRLKNDVVGGGVSVVACDGEGGTLGSGSLITFEEDGTISRRSSISAEIGFQLDGAGRVKLQGE